MAHLPYQKGRVGRSSNLLREDKAFEKVALSAEDFRRVAILRDVHPQIMPKDRNSPWSYFHKDDLRMINNDPMSWFIREYSSWQKAHKKSVARQEERGVSAPKAPYSELIRSRYPTPADAIRDLDDALTTVALFAQMSGNDLISSERVVKCRQLMAEFHYYVSRSHTMTKAFISVRGFYFEARIEGIPVVWLVPHRFPLQKDISVDYKVLLDFLELYEHLVGFMNARLFRMIGMNYPPTFDKEKWNKRFYIDAIMDVVEEEHNEEVKAETSESSDKLSAAIAAAAAKADEGNEDELQVESKGIFDNLVFSFDNKVPADPLILIIRSLGGTVVYEENSDSSRITHTVTDSKTIAQHTFGRVYVQPQWIFDSLNARSLQDANLYRPGAELPPHLSPFDNTPALAEESDGEFDVDEVDSDDEIDQDIKRIALENEFAAGVGEADQTDRANLKQLKSERKKALKEERERLAAGTLSSAKSKLYRELKEKEETKKNQKPLVMQTNEEEDSEEVEIHGDNLEEEE